MKITQNTQSLSFETFSRSNQDTCLSQRPLIKQGQWVGKGQLLADCIDSVSGDLALGKNVLVAYMPWEGYNFEDSIVISDRLIADDVYTSIHILRFRTEVVNSLSPYASNTKPTNKTYLPYEQFSIDAWLQCNIRNIQQNSKKFNSFCFQKKQAIFFSQSNKIEPVRSSALDSSWDTIKISPISSLFTPRIKKYDFDPKFANYTTRALLLQSQAIKTPLPCFFLRPCKQGSKSTSLLLLRPKDLPSKFISCKAGKSFLPCKRKEARKQVKQRKPVRLEQSKEAKISKNQQGMFFSSKQNKPSLKVTSPFISKRPPTLKTQRKFNENRHANSVETRTPNIPFLGEHLVSHLDQNGIAKVGTWVSSGDILVGKVRPLANKLKSNRASTQLAWEIISNKKNESINVEDKSFRLPKGVSGRVIRTEVLPHSSSEQIHIYLAVKRKIRVGDKLAGRHGNKGIVSLILPKQDMPYLADGTPIDIILSPLGVPSRMNVGQIYECLLGLAAKSLICDFKIGSSMSTIASKKLRFPNRGMPSFPSRTYQVSKQNNERTNKAQVSKNLEISPFDTYTLTTKEASAILALHRKQEVQESKFLKSLLPKTNWVSISNTSCTYSIYRKHLMASLKNTKTIINNKKLGLTKNQIEDKSRYYKSTRLTNESTAISNFALCKQAFKDTLATTGSVFFVPKTKKATPFLLLQSKKKLLPCKQVLCLPLVKNGVQVSKDLLCFWNKKSKSKQELNQNKQLFFCSNLEARNLVFLKLYHSRITSNKKWLFSLTNPGKMKIFDGRTGQPFSSWVTVGYAYMLKLIHLVDNKIHSRSTGPYSLLTRQPVTGKARHGGQRIGEMEAWALEGFGAAYTLQEFFSFKGDDVSSRHQWQVTSLSKLVGNTTAFKTFLSELRALCISLEFTGFTEEV